MPFALDADPSQTEISDAINYLLSNFTLSNSINPDTGQVVGPGGVVLGYIYQYIAIKYADDQFGTGFSNSPTNKSWYGINNSNNASESSNPADYVWYQAAGGFGITKFLWYITTGGRQIQFAVSPTAPDSGWLVDPGSSIDLDVVTSSTTPVIAESFLPYFAPPILQVPRSGGPLTPTFTGVIARMYATDAGVTVPFTDAQTDSNVAFVNNSWRIGNSSTTGNGDISYTNITVGAPTDGGDYAQWPAPTAMSASPAYITVPVRYKNSTGAVSQAGVATIQYVFADPGAAGQNSPYIDISGYTGFSVNSGGAFTPANATLSAVIASVTSPTYSWAITNATPTSSTASTVVITPNSGATSVGVTLTVNGTNLLSPLSKTISMPVTFDGVPGTAGANGIMSAFPSIYIWTGSSSVPTRPSTTSTYTWATGAYSAPSGWSTTVPSNTTPGNYLWEITVPLNVSATTTTSTLDWTNTSYPIRCIAYNGSQGPTGTSGSATFLVTRSANDSSAPTNAEVNAVIGRNPVAGDIVTVSYNSANNAVVYRYTTSWITQATYITGSLIVDQTITASKFVSGIVWTSDLIVTTPGQSAPTISGTTMTGAGSHLYSDGKFAMGNSSTNITFNGTTATLNGFSNISYTSIAGYTLAGKIGSSATGNLPIAYAARLWDFSVGVAGDTTLLFSGVSAVSTTESSAVYGNMIVNIGIYTYSATTAITSISTGSMISIIDLGTTDWNLVFGTSGISYRSQDSGFINGTTNGNGTAIILTRAASIGSDLEVGRNSTALLKNSFGTREMNATLSSTRRANFSVNTYTVLMNANFDARDSAGSYITPTVRASITLLPQFLAQQIRV